MKLGRKGITNLWKIKLITLFRVIDDEITPRQCTDKDFTYYLLYWSLYSQYNKLMHIHRIAEKKLSLREVNKKYHSEWKHSITLQYHSPDKISADRSLHFTYHRTMFTVHCSNSNWALTSNAATYIAFRKPMRQWWKQGGGDNMNDHATTCPNRWLIQHESFQSQAMSHHSCKRLVIITVNDESWHLSKWQLSK